MSLLAHHGLLMLALTLGFNSSLSTHPQPPVSTFNSHQSSDDAAVRELTERYGRALSGGDLATMRQFWDPQSPNIAGYLKTYQGVFSTLRLDFLRISVTRLEVTGDKAVSHLTTDERLLDNRTGTVLGDRDAYHGACRSFEWIKTGVGWKIESAVLVQEQLAGKLEAAGSENERLELLEKEKPFVTDVLVNALIQRSARHRTRQELDAAMHCAQLSQAVAEEIGDEAGKAGALLELGTIKEQHDDYEQALPVLQKALALYKAAGLKRGVAFVLVRLGTLYRSLGDYRLAFESAKESLRLYEEEANRGEGIVRALEEMADVYSEQNDFPQTLAYLERAMAIAQEIGDKIHIAILRVSLAQINGTLGNYERALEIYQEVLKQTEGFGDKAGAAVIRDEIGNILAAQGRYAEALDYHRQALSTLETAGEKKAQAETLINLSDTYLAEGKYAEALPISERAVLLTRQTGLQLDLWLALSAVGQAQLGLSNTAQARQAFTEAVSIVEKLRAQTAGGVDERRRYFEGGLRAYHGMFSLLVKENQPREALEFAERTKGRVLLDVLENGGVDIQRAMIPEEREQERRLKTELTMLNRQVTHVTQSDEPDPQRLGELTRQLEKARLAYEAFQTSLYSAHPELKIHRGEGPIIKAEELAALLPDASSALLEYVVTDDQSYLFAITRTESKGGVDVRLFRLPFKRAELEKQTEAFREQLARRDLGFRASAVKLYDLLVKPAEAQLKGKSNLVIVPDDKLWELPFQALINGAKRFLIEDAAVAYAPSLTVLGEMTRRRPNQHSEALSPNLLAFGNPTVGKQTIEKATMATRDEKLSPLPESEQEVKALGHLYGSSHSKVYVGADASEERVKREAGKAGVLHFATHGILNNASPMYSHLVLAQGNGSEDGLLEAWEIMQLDLKADLAILSACETARGRYSAGEGMVGLTWAMFVAGVPATVVSQWKVEAASTRDLLVNFHSALTTPPGAGKPGTTKAEALRRAALKLMKNPETSHPFYWAAFVLVGDGR